MLNGRCRMHGGKSTGPQTADGVAAIRAARTIHGGYSAEMQALRMLMRQLRLAEATIREKTGPELD